MHYKALIEIKDKKTWRERTLYIRSNNGILGVLEVCRKVRNAKLLHAKEISHKQYIKGVSN